MCKMNYGHKVYIAGVDTKMESIFKSVFGEISVAKRAGICGFIDNQRAERYHNGLPVYLVDEIKDLDYTKIVIANGGNYQVWRDELVYGYNVEPNKIADANYLINLRILERDECGGGDVAQTLRNIEKQDKFDTWCGFCPQPRKDYEIIWDRLTNMPYTIFFGKRMYFPRDKKFVVKNGKLYVTGLEFEQQAGSPHTYITEKNQVDDGDVIVDAGVCEGNFALRFIDKASKIYLIEANPSWRYPLELTFREYLDKVVFVNKFLSDKDDEKNVTLDSLIGDGRVDFIKMDIEGAEPSALKGGEKVFRNNNIKCSICSYHRHDDEEKIKAILTGYGYNVEHSHGHMIFPYDPDRFKWSELRHGIVYGIR